jgi:biopolymer transport protein ExbB
VAVIARHRHSSMADVSMMAGDVASRDLRRHVQKAYPLAIVATVSPLLGLFGTVIGMIGAFDKVAAAGSLGDASLLGGDISKALITTAAGLSIAIPTLVCYHYFRNRTSQFALQLEEEAGELISDWFSSAPADATGAADVPSTVEVSADEG